MRSEIKGILTKLKGILAKVEISLSKAEDAEREEAIDRLSSEVDCINEAIESLENIE